MSQAEDVTHAVLEALDYGALGSIYCDDGGDAFWSEKRDEVARCGAAWAAEMAARLKAGGDSLYVGAGVAELPAMITEVVGLERRVRAINLRADECAILNRALEGQGLSDRLMVEARDVQEVEGVFDHVAIVSVLTDPETWPHLSELTYGRIPIASIDTERFAVEHAEASDVAAATWRRLSLPGLLTTTFEEFPWFLGLAEEDGVRVEADDTLLETAIVGDPIGFAVVAR